MPSRSLHFCAHSGCFELTTNKYCAEHADQDRCDRNDRDRMRGSAAERGYNARWQKARDGFLAKHPLCESCMQSGKLVPATVVDHIKPHKGDKALFWDSSNWQALCKRCHDIKTAKENGRWGRGV
nr:HNH endonuclease signature motif containing protein [Papillibacter cinnamivorans]